MPARVAAAGAVLVSIAAVAIAAYVRTLPGAGDTLIVVGHGPSLGAGLVAVAWTMTGADLAQLRPRNPLGWLLVVVGVCQRCSRG